MIDCDPDNPSDYTVVEWYICLQHLDVIDMTHQNILLKTDNQQYIYVNNSGDGNVQVNGSYIPSEGIYFVSQNGKVTLGN